MLDSWIVGSVTDGRNRAPSVHSRPKRSPIHAHGGPAECSADWTSELGRPGPRELRTRLDRQAPGREPGSAVRLPAARPEQAVGGRASRGVGSLRRPAGATPREPAGRQMDRGACRGGAGSSRGGTRGPARRGSRARPGGVDPSPGKRPDGPALPPDDPWTPPIPATRTVPSRPPSPPRARARALRSAAGRLPRGSPPGRRRPRNRPPCPRGRGSDPGQSPPIPPPRPRSVRGSGRRWGSRARPLRRPRPPVLARRPKGARASSNFPRASHGARQSIR